MNIKRGKLKNNFLSLLILVLFISLCSFVSAEIVIKNSSIEGSYFGGQNIRGWINMSLTNEPYDTLVSAFDKPVFLLNFLNKNNLSDKSGISCSTVNCSEGYDLSSEAFSDTLNLAEGMSTLLGFKIDDTSEIQAISAFLLDISTDAGTSCSENMQIPLKVDILDDGSFEWTSNGSSNDKPNSPFSCGEKNYGCYDPSNGVHISPTFITSTEIYCETIVVGPGGGIEVGADLSCSGNANFTITINSLGIPSQSKPVPFYGGNSIGLSFNFSSESSRNVTVCIQAKPGSANICNLSRQNNGNKSCGKSGNTAYDFSIYARPIAYSVPTNFSISSSNYPTLNQNILNYLALKYNKNCSKGCIIPIKIISNQKQELIIKNSYITRKSGDISISTSHLDKLTKISPLVSMNYTVLDLSKSGLIVPSAGGNHTLNLWIGDKLIQKQIYVSNIPIVEFVFPYEVIVSEDTKFSAYSNSSTSITGYKWDFGDGSSEQSTTNASIVHKYPSTGQYNLKVTANSSKGQISSIFSISVITLSKEEIIKKLTENNENLAKIEIEINKLPVWLKDYIHAQVKVNDTRIKVNDFISSLNSTENLTEVISFLNSPSVRTALSFGLSESSSGIFLVDKNKINLAYLGNAGAGTINTNMGEDFYKKAIYNWLMNNLNINIEEKVYSLFYEDRTEQVGSYFKIILTPRNEYADKLFLVINKNSNTLVFKDRLRTRNESQATIITLNGSSNQEIEMFVNGRMDPADIPVYLSPEFSKLDLFSNPKCFIDGKCDSSIGEDAETCPSDCNSSIMQITISIIILLILAFIVYIILQEWYKKRYEDYLFKSKDDLYNVINFISNAEKQAMSKSEIFSKLLDMKWSNEQIIFAYKKFHGQRTGMYEIPVLKIFEKKKIQTEIGKRQAAGNMGNIAPSPMIMPPKERFMIGQKTNLQPNINKTPDKKV